MKPGIYTDLSNEEYHAGPGLSKSGIDQILKSPLHYRAWLDERGEQTKAMVIGSAVHAAVLEPKIFSSEYVTKPDLNRRTKAGKAEYAAWLEKNAGKTVLSDDDFVLVNGIANAVRESDAGERLLREGKPEVSIYWTDTRTGQEILCKCRPDYLREDGIIVDLKTCQDASPDGFARAAAKFNYHIQAAYYLEGARRHGIQARSFVFLCVEKKPPYAVAAYQLDAEAIEAGGYLAMSARWTLAGCLEKDEWPGYQARIETVSLPRWAAI